MRWQSSGIVTASNRSRTSLSPMVRLGTNRLSMMSTCNQSASCSTDREASMENPAASRLGATTSDGPVTDPVYEHEQPARPVKRRKNVHVQVHNRKQLRKGPQNGSRWFNYGP